MSSNDDYTVEDVTLPIKRTTGETLQDRMTSNAYENILPARYLRENKDGEIIEEQEDLFKRVAKNVALAEVVYKSRELGDSVTARPNQVKKNHSDRASLVEEIFEITAHEEDGELIYEEDAEVEITEENVNKFAYDTIVPELENDELKEHVVETKETFQQLMEHLNFIPNSPTLMNAGDELQQLSACFVDSPKDDIVDIHETASEAAQVFQSGGGMGYAFWELRPYGDPVGSTGGIASGPVTFMRTYDQMCETIAQGGKRRGAQMAVMKIAHPDVIEFIHSKNKDVSLARALKLNDPDDHTHTNFEDALEEARELIQEVDGQKQVPKFLRNAIEGHLSNFNISVGVTDNFMETLKNEEEFTFTNPRTGDPHIATEETKEMYERYGLGEYVTVGEPLKIPATVLWERIAEGAHENGEPGVIYLSTVNKKHSFDVEKHPEYEMKATNPCGEQPLMEYEACNLGHINLSTIASKDAPDWRVWYEENAENYSSVEQAMDDFVKEAINMEELNKRIEIGTRFLENVATMSEFPVGKIGETVSSFRKIGLGVMGLAQLYIQLGLKYGSEPANLAIEHIMTHINHKSKEASHNLAKTRGSFDEWENSKYATPTEYPEWFKNHTGEDPEAWEDGYPIRNHNTTTVAPTGTTSMVGNTTGGIEPIYNVAYYKNVSQDIQGDEMLVEFDDYFLRVLEANDIDVETVKEEAKELMSNNKFDGVEQLSTVPDSISTLFITTQDLRGKEHAAVQTACQKGVDSSISKTCNFPREATVDDIKEVYEFIHENGGKGVTVYRDGTRSKQVKTTREQNAAFLTNDREEMLEQVLTEFNLGEEAISLINDALQNISESDEVGLSEFVEELAAIEKVEELIVQDYDFGHAKKQERPNALYGVSQRIDTGYGKVYVTINEDPATGRPFELFANIGNSGGYTNSFTEAIAKVISIALRSGVDPDEIVEELKGTRSPKIAWDQQDRIESIPDAIGTALDRYLNGELRRPVPVNAEKEDESINEVPSEQETDETDTDEKESNPDTNGSTGALIQDGEAPECPECGSMDLYYSEGCKTCQACGWSECS